MKNIIATIVGLIAAFLIVFIFETLIGHTFFPLPEGANPSDMEWIKNNIDKVPMGSKIFVVIGHFMGIAIGMFVAGLISKTNMIPAYIVGGFMVAATFFTIFMLPKELWFTLSDGILAFVGFLIGASLAKKQMTKE